MKITLLLAVCMGFLACGVKNDVQPPETPAEIGTGKPLYKNPDQQRKDIKKNEKGSESDSQ
jgi:hypothetical protein